MYAVKTPHDESQDGPAASRRRVVRLTRRRPTSTSADCISPVRGRAEFAAAAGRPARPVRRAGPAAWRRSSVAGLVLPVAMTESHSRQLWRQTSTTSPSPPPVPLRRDKHRVRRLRHLFAQKMTIITNNNHNHRALFQWKLLYLNHFVSAFILLLCGSHTKLDRYASFVLVTINVLKCFSVSPIYGSVTRMLFELDLPSFDTLFLNSKRRFETSFSVSSNTIITALSIVH